MIRRSVTAAIVLASTAICAAQPVGTAAEPPPNADTPSAASIAPPRPIFVDEKSALLTGTLTFGVPLASFAALVVIVDREATTTTRVIGVASFAGLLLAPTLGSLYAGAPWNGGFRTRLVGVGIVAIGLALIPSADQRSELAAYGVVGVIVTGCGVYITGVIIETVIAQIVVHDHNRRVRDLQLGIAPIAGSIGTAPGLVLGGRF